ncbi:hypothetical protein Lfu02_49590 [Longispora fulva]|uniref:HNH endonuclease n=1 Tax=Longispora fulva TaxID=619741 RepID=A0A8J7KKN2_9ACTN|nr:HNH endonuclease [Longispora fulva]MBG6138334.1 hypothetical protein [Longispora fulva]GIG60587.1 hypothetical protein Lfu02_49590 [Longispora fulva]
MIPPGVRRLPSGRLPANFTFAGKKYDGPRWTPRLVAKYPDGVTFTPDGYPNFSQYQWVGIPQVEFDPTFTGDRAKDDAIANRKAGIEDTPDGYTWHHHQDGRTMQLVPTDIHEAVRHAGGVAIVKGNDQ